MWLTTVVVERSQLVDGPHDQVYSLLADPAVWSLHPDHFAFEVAAPPDSGRLYCWLGAHHDHLDSSLLTVREEVPGERIGFRTPAPGVPQGELTFTLSAVPERARVKVTITVRHTVPRGSKPHTGAYWARRLKVWLHGIRAVVEGRSPQPGTEIPPDMWQRYAGRRELRNPVTATAATLIAAPPVEVWEMFWAPERLSALREDVFCAGHVPGTPEGQVGELQYQILHRTDGNLWPAVYTVLDLVPGHRALLQSTTPSHDEMHHLFTPVADGTRVELTWRAPARALKRSPRKAHDITAELRALLDDCRTKIEESPEREP
jgi:hypothetical protein